jgi:hypothetical protein
VESGGKDKLVTFREVLGQLGLTTWILTDLDFLWNGAGSVLGADPDLARFNEQLNDLVPAIPPHARNDARDRERKRQLKTACSGQLSAQRNTICDRLRSSDIFVLREGEIEDYVGLTQGSKGQYLKAAEEIRAGIRTIEHQDDLIALWMHSETGQRKISIGTRIAVL